MLALNHWIDRFPPQPSLNRAVSGEFLEDARAAAGRSAGCMPNLLTVDFYDRSGVVEAAAAINAVPPVLPGG